MSNIGLDASLRSRAHGKQGGRTFGVSTALILTLALAGSIQAQPGDPTDRAPVADIIARHYWRALRRDSIDAALARAGFSALDPYSYILPAADWAYLNALVDGSFGGIGAVLNEDSLTGEFRFTGLLMGSPALSAGLRANDVLVAVDGIPVLGVSLDDVLFRLRGSVGTTVVVGVRRQADPLTLSIRRGRIQMPTVRGFARNAEGVWNYLVRADDAVAYVRIVGFARTTPTELDSALVAIRRTPARALILDLRGNQGGLFSAAVAVADRFLSEGVVVTTRGRTEGDSVYVAAPDVATEIPMALLIDGQTASAAEVLGAALQDNRRAVVVGRQSFGKGLVQQLFPLPDSARAVRLTTHAYVRPSGIEIERHAPGADSTLGGIWPDPGMSVAVTADQDAAISETLRDADARAPVAGALVPGLDLDTDRALRRAFEALREITD